MASLFPAMIDFVMNPGVETGKAYADALEEAAAAAHDWAAAKRELGEAEKEYFSALGFTNWKDRAFIAPLRSVRRFASRLDAKRIEWAARSIDESVEAFNSVFNSMEQDADNVADFGRWQSGRPGL